MNSKINTNQPVPCPYCRHFPVRCRSREMNRDKQSVMLEHQWICPKCQNIARCNREHVPVTING